MFYLNLNKQIFAQKHKEMSNNNEDLINTLSNALV